MIRTVLLTTALLAGVTGVLAQNDPIAERNSLMGALWREGLGPVVRMVRGQAQYDAEAVEKSFARMSEVAERLPALWPPNSQVTNPTTRFYSSPRVWEDKADFDARMARMRSAIAENRARATSGPEGAKLAFETVNQTCDSCHERYQLRAR